MRQLQMQFPLRGFRDRLDPAPPFGDKLRITRQKEMFAIIAARTEVS
jgi:hypothetical protein